MKFKTILLAVILVTAGFASLCAQEMIENPSYQQWARFAPGAIVKYSQSALAMGNDTKSEISYKLVELTPVKAVVEMTTATTVMGNRMEMPPTKMEHSAKIPKTTVQAKLHNPDMKEFEETISLAGKTFKCKVIEIPINQQGASGVSKSWISDAIPGGLVKVETEMTKPMKTRTEMKLIEISNPR